MRPVILGPFLLIMLFAAACGGGKSVDSLSVGDCFDDPPSFDTEIESVDTLDCDEPHDNEVYLTRDHSAGSDASYPGLASLEEWSDGVCLAGFEPYVGRDYATSRLDFTYLYPVRDGWQNGDREVICFLYDLNYAKLTGSMRGSGE